MRILFKLLFLLLNTTFFAQSSKVIYVKYKTHIVNNNEEEKSPDVKRGLELYVNAVESIEFELVANEKMAIFKKVDKLDIEKPHPLASSIGTGVYFTNLNSKEKIKQIELGKTFNVIIPFDEYSWEITSESKVINGFKCYKAKTRKETFISWKNKISISTPEVWFAPEIPLGYGPFGLINLPGLVLEATLNGKTYYYATEINLDYKGISSAKIEWPNKGKFVNENELQDIEVKMFPKH